MTAFWVLAILVACALVGITSWALGANGAWGAVGVTVLLPGAIWKPWFELGIRGWNKVVTVASRALRAYVLKLSYYVLFAVVGGTSSVMDSSYNGQSRSRWVPRQGALEHRSAGEQQERGLKAWVGQRYQLWRLSFVPVMLLLSMLGDERESGGPPSGTYTLY